MNKLKTFMMPLFFVCNMAYANQSELNLADIKGLSLKECLDINYNKFNLYTKPGLNDKSYLFTWYSLDNKSSDKSQDLKNYIQQKTGDFYLSKPPVKNPESNMIFIMCMRFYNSQELDNYIKDNILK